MSDRLWLGAGGAALLILLWLARQPMARAKTLAGDLARVGRRLFDDLHHDTCDWFAARGEVFGIAFIALLGLVIYVPYLGSYPLWDPWEPHYTQVAWEMANHDTWLNPFYRDKDNWWSKPILMLWMLRLSLGALWDASRDFANPEFAARLPFALCAVLGGVLQYAWVRRLFGRAVGVVAAVVLLTAPQYLMIGRQVMVDMAFVASYAAAMGFLAVGLFAEAEGTWWRRNHPFVLFWSLQAVAMLAKGFVPPALAVLVLSAYAIATFRWRDHSDLVAGRYWPKYLLQRGAVAALVVGAAVIGVGALGGINVDRLRMVLQALVFATAGLVVVLGVFADFPVSRHALRLLRAMRVHWGLPLFFAIGAPWFVYMTFKHGWPYWNEWLFYHHLGRAAGTIDKPADTFEFYVRQIGVGMFPWSALLPGSLWLFAERADVRGETIGRRTFYVLLCAALPYLFFTLSGTKFAHYIFPVVPFLAVMVAITLLSLRTDRHTRGKLIVIVTLTLVSLGLLAQDLALDFRLFQKTFIYYHARATTPGFAPSLTLQAIFLAMGVTIGALLLRRALGWGQMTLLAALGVVLACYLGWVVMPAMASTYSYKPLLAAYTNLAQASEPIGQYNDWQTPERSVVFLFQNRCEHLKNKTKTVEFLRREGRKFIIVERKELSALRRIADDLGKKLYVVFDDHPDGRLVSDVPTENDLRKVAAHIVREVPPTVRRLDARFGDTIELIGARWEPEAARRGEELRVHFYYRALKSMDKDWEIFVHADASQTSPHRLRSDHFPVDGLHATTEWQEGEIIDDVFTLKIPRDYPKDEFTLWTGFFREETRLDITSGANDGENRLRGPRVKVVD